MSDNKMYDILGKFNNLDPQLKPVTDKDISQPVYETVEPKGDIMEAVRSLEEKYKGFKKEESIEEDAKPDFLDLDKDGDKKESMKKAAKDAMKKKEHGVNEGVVDSVVNRAKEKYHDVQAKRNASKHAEIADWDKEQSQQYLDKAIQHRTKRQELTKQRTGSTYNGLEEGEYDPAPVDPEAVAKRKRLQAIKDRQEAERAERGDDYKSKSKTFVPGKAYGGAAQKDDEEKDLDEVSKKTLGSYVKKASADIAKREVRIDRAMDPSGSNLNEPSMQKALNKNVKRVAGLTKATDKLSQVDEVAPPGAKAERMVKHIKKGYAKDGNLTKREKGIAYATAWKAHKAGKVEESLTESRNSVMEGSSYTYEKVADILAAEQPGLDVNSTAFEKAVYDQLIKMHLSPKAARWNVYYDEDFLSDCATAYAHNLKQQAAEVAELSMNTQEPLLDATQELDEIARLAGLPTKTCESCDCDPCKCDESVGCSMEELDEAATRKDFRAVANLIKNIPDEVKRKELANHHADIFKQQNPRFKRDVFLSAAGVNEGSCSMSEEAVDEGNEFTKARLDAIAAGKDTFTVGGKEHKVTGDTSAEKAQVESIDDEKQAVTEDINVNITATGEQDVVALIQKLAGMPVVAVAPQPEIAVAEEVVEEERDIEWDNTPEEKIAPLSAAIPSGTDLHKSKLQDPHTANKAANPLGEEKVEESLWTAYEAMINDLKA